MTKAREQEIAVANKIKGILEARIKHFQKMLNEDEYTKSNFALQQTMNSIISEIKGIRGMIGSHFRLTITSI